MSAGLNGGYIHGAGLVDERDRGPSCCEQFVFYPGYDTIFDTCEMIDGVDVLKDLCLLKVV